MEFLLLLILIFNLKIFFIFIIIFELKMLKIFSCKYVLLNFKYIYAFCVVGVVKDGIELCCLWLWLVTLFRSSIGWFTNY